MVRLWGKGEGPICPEVELQTGQKMCLQQGGQILSQLGSMGLLPGSGTGVLPMTLLMGDLLGDRLSYETAAGAPNLSTEEEPLFWIFCSPNSNQ